jgi:transposase InsO family protein
VKYAWIKEHVVAFQGRLALLCRALGVTRQGYYAWKKRLPGKRAQRKKELVTKVKETHQRSRQTYGSPRVFRELKAEQVKISENTVAKYMREESLSARSPKPFRPQTTDSDHAEPVAENQLQQEFVRATPDTGYVADITYIPTAEGWLFLAIVLDLFSRRIVGHATSADLRAGLAIAALTQALQQRRPASGAWSDQGLLFHSDRGVQYASGAFRAVLEAHGIQRSMSRTGNCYDNAVAESFFATLKRELVGAQPFASRQEARQAIFEWIEVFYNRQRRHSSLGYVSPEQFELQYAARAA